MQRDEHGSVEATRDRRAFVERQVAIILPSHCDADSAALHEEVAKILRERQRQILFTDFARDTGRAGIAAAVARIDDDDGTAARFGSTIDSVAGRRWKVDGETCLRRPASRSQNEREPDHGHRRDRASDHPFVEPSRHPALPTP